MAAAWRAREGGVDLFVRLTPKSARNAVEGIAADDAGRTFLKVRVRAVPEDGAANAALCALIAVELGLPKRSVEISAGATQRLKTLRLSGDPSAILAVLERLGGGWS